MKRYMVSVSLCLLFGLAVSGCGGGGGSGGGTPETGVLTGPHLYRDLEKTLPEVLDEQADSADEGVIREFVATRSFLLLPPNTFTRPWPPTWRVDDTSTLDSDAYIWPAVDGGHVLHIRGRAGLRGTYPFTGEDAVEGWGADPDADFIWPALFGGSHPSDVGIQHDFAVAYAVAGNDGTTLQYAAYGWWAMAPVPGGGASDTTRTLSAHGGMSLGIETFPRDMPGSVDSPVAATWSGPATGHAQDADGRWVLEGDTVLTAELQGPSGRIRGMLDNMRIARIDPETLQVDASTAGDWHEFRLMETPIEGNGYKGRLSVIGTPQAGPRFFTPAGAYEGAFYGPEAAETAGQWWLIEAYADVSMGEKVVVGAFGGRRMPDSQP
ncbi:MAG: hypothetical protein OXE53_02125 [Deltaproteobacteria bacterium]|nr:hypothetical protein [Deltaproteobacteria bacterium]